MIRSEYPTLMPLASASLCLLLVACSPEQGPEEATDSAQQSVAPLSETDARVIALSDAEIEEVSKAAYDSVNLEPEEGLEVSLWAPDLMLGDPVAINVDYQGRIWAAVTQRSNNSEFDIRGYRDWEEASMTFETVEDRRAFLRTELAPERSEENADRIPDRNEDGSHDWRDLAVVKEQVVLLEDTSGSGRVNESRIFLNDFHTEVTDVLGGIYYHNELDELFLAVAPNAWRVKDTSGDRRADTKTQLSEGFGVHIGFSGHGMSGMTLGPDGRIYYAIGDIGFNYTDPDGREWSYPNEGVVVRSEPDGSNFEVFSAGVRNTHEFTFDKYGNLITVDNDGDHDGEYERLTYLIDGSDSGWRINWQLGKYRDERNNQYKVWMDENYYTPRFDGQAAHLLPPIAPYHSGPTGMTYNPGTAWSEEWRDHFFVVEFVGSAPRSGIHAFTLEPKGASFELSSDRDIFRGLQATGIDFGPDGALYMSDWVEGWQRSEKGRIWKMDVAEGADSELRRDTQALLGADFGELDTERLREHLAHADMRVRQKAQFELVARDERELLETVAARGADQLARIHAIWGLGQLSRRDGDYASALVSLLSDEDDEIRAQAAKVLGDTPYPGAFSELVSRLTDDSLRVQFFAAQALGRIGDRDAFEPILAMLEANDDEDVYLRQAGAIALERLGHEAGLAALAEHPSEALQIAAVVALTRMESPALVDFLDDSSEFVATNAARGIGDDVFVDEALPALAQRLNEPPHTNEPLLRRAINANLYVGGDAAAERLLAFAQRDDIDGELRAEAIATLSVWEKTSPFDRVTGRYRGVREYPIEQARDVLSGQVDRLMDDGSAAVRLAVVKAVGQLAIESAQPRLVEALGADTSVAVRAEILQALYEFGYEDMRQVAETALQDPDQSLRMTALELMPDLGLPADELVEMHRLLLASGTTGEQQAAYRSLANIDDDSAYELLGEALAQLESGELAAELQLDVLEAAEATGQASLQAQIEAYEAGKDRDSPLNVYRETLHGGDALVGFDEFRNNTSAQCMRCHQVNDRGSRVGPDLEAIASILSREELLEALVDPNARVPAGHGRVSVTLENGNTVSGFYEEETETSMVIVDGGESVEVAKADVLEKTYSGSGMPPMNHMLSRREIRDLVEFLTTLTDEESAAAYWE